MNKETEGWDKTLKQGQKFNVHIRNTLEDDYHLGIGVFQEWVANADDAKATDFKICLDLDKYPTGSLLGPKMAEWQGPAILVYNNGIFTENDWKGFTKRVGNSNKKGDTESIGTFGLGALTFYHFTDMISVVSGKNVLFLDVQGKWLPDGENSLFGNYMELGCSKKYRDQFLPFTNSPFGFNLDKEFKGTIFRIPLRTTELAAISKISTTCFAEDLFRGLEELMVDFAKKAHDMLLFLRIVERIEIIKSWNSKTMSLYAIQLEGLTPSDKSKRNQTNTLGGAGMAWQFKLNVRTLCNPESTLTNWLICQALGSTEEMAVGAPQFKQSKFQKRTLKPVAGVAVKLQEGSQLFPKFQGSSFSFLPILGDPVGIPVHINGAFYLSKTRRDIITGTDGKLHLL